MQAILQQMIVASPSVNVKSYSSKKEKSGHIKTRKRKSRDEIYVDPKEAEAASTAAKVLEEAFHQLCEMCGHYFQVGAKVINPKYTLNTDLIFWHTQWIVVAVKYYRYQSLRSTNPGTPEPQIREQMLGGTFL